MMTSGRAMLSKDMRGEETEFENESEGMYVMLEGGEFVHVKLRAYTYHLKYVMASSAATYELKKGSPKAGRNKTLFPLISISILVMALLHSSACFRSLAAFAHFVPSQSTPVAGGCAMNSSSALSCPRFTFNCSNSSPESLYSVSHHFVRDSSFALKFGFVPARFQPSRASASATDSVTGQSIHDFTVKDIDGNDVSLSKYKGKVLLIVNVASRCGLTTSNYNELTELYDKLKGQDFEILAFPCNQFGAQEPGTNEQIKVFACTRFKAEYPIFDKVDVNGENAAPVYKFLKSTKGSGILNTLLGGNIKWNFEKFLVGKDGQVVQRYDPTTSPLKIENDIKKLLES